MKNINIFCAALIAAATLSCSKSDEGVVDPSSNVPQMTISAYGDGSRTVIGSGSTNTDGVVSWSVGDKISLHKEEDGTAVEFTTDITEIAEIADFTGNEFTNDAGTYYALYPHNSATTADYTEKTMTFTIADTQTHNPDEINFAQGAFASVAKATDLENVAFTNLMGGIKIELTGSGIITSIEVSTNEDTSFPICGTATVDMSSDTPEITSITNAGTTVTLDCGEGVELNTSTAETFMIAIPPTTRTLYLKFIRKDGSYSTAKSISWDVVRNGIKYTGLKWNTEDDLAFVTPTENDGSTAEKAIQTTIAEIISFASTNSVDTTGKAFSDDKYYYYEAIMTTNYSFGNMFDKYIGMQTSGATGSGNGIFISLLNATYTNTLKLHFGNKIKVIIPPAYDNDENNNVVVIKDSYGCVMLQGYENSGSNPYFSVIDSTTTTINPIDITASITGDFVDYSAYQGMYVTIDNATIAETAAGLWRSSTNSQINQILVTVGDSNYKTAIFTKGGTSGFAADSKYVVNSRGTLTGVVTPNTKYVSTMGKGNGGVAQIAPQSLDDVSAFTEETL